MPDDQYPEHEKLAKVQDRSQAVGEFLEWLTSEQHYVIAEYEGDTLWPVQRALNSWLAQFFQIDPVALEREKRAMLDHQRALNDLADAQVPTEG
jgi:hypothetical protein